MAPTISATGLLICEPKICEVGGGGLILPIFGDDEQRWANGFRVILYFGGLLWTFMGVAIVADVFMGAIERVTSQKRRAVNKHTGRAVTVNVWNDTVANLTLMALGSSAPEILLSLIELLGNRFYAGDLGPSTIVGSAAFNLLCIIAVCVCSIPNNEVRIIKEWHVYAVTASFSLFAYFWLYSIVAITSEDVIDIWEGVLTLFFFPLMVFLAFLADKGVFSEKGVSPEELAPSTDITDMTPQEVAELEMAVQIVHEGKLTIEQVAKVIEEGRGGGHRSRAHYRVGAIRSIVGGHRVSAMYHDSHAEAKTDFSKVLPAPTEGFEEPIKEKAARTTVVLGFSSSKFVVAENIGTLPIPVEMFVVGEDALNEVVTVSYKTRDGTAKQKDDYEHIEGTLEFFPGDDKQTITIKIMDDEAFEDAEEFYVDLFHPNTDQLGCIAMVGENATATIKIVDDDRPGVVSFKEEVMTIPESHEDKEISVVVVRKGGCVGRISVKYKTEDDSALAGLDFVKAEGVINFASGQASAEFPLIIKPRGRYQSTDLFRVIIFDVVGGARLEKSGDGGETRKICTINITGSDTKKDNVDRVMHQMRNNWEKAQIGHSNWRDQFTDAIYINGGGSGDDGDEDEPAPKPGCLMWFLHFLTLPWKLLFAIIPPSDFCNGWLCFCCSLIMIGVVTAFIGDLASLLGCTMGVPDGITAITLVALGTSLPDTFASKAAAVQDPYADASVGNVTGSNSVNVFLGIGLSWVVGSLYWDKTGLNPEWAAKYPGVLAKYPNGGKFVVIGGDLGYSVMVFTCCAVISMTILVLRRIFIGGELGGPAPWAQISSGCLVALWFVYIGLSSWQTMSSYGSRSC